MAVFAQSVFFLQYESDRVLNVHNTQSKRLAGVSSLAANLANRESLLTCPVIL